MDKNILAKIVRWVVIIAIPFVLTLGAVRLLIVWDNPSYPEVEYGRIPPDSFGFTQEQRLELAEATLAYLRRPEPAEEVIFMLEELRLPGTDQPLYIEREIGHMLDVKRVADRLQQVFRILLLVVLAGLAYLFFRPETRPDGARALMCGGLVTVFAVVFVMVFIGIAWSLVFTLFHTLLFPPGTWTFNYSDSLIRLFPEQFWFDFGVLWTATILVMGAILAVIGYFLGKKWA